MSSSYQMYMNGEKINAPIITQIDYFPEPHIAIIMGTINATDISYVEALKVMDWATKSGVYKNRKDDTEITLEVVFADRKAGTITIDRAVVLHYSEIYTDRDGFGHFELAVQSRNVISEYKYFPARKDNGMQHILYRVDDLRIIQFVDQVKFPFAISSYSKKSISGMLSFGLSYRGRTALLWNTYERIGQTISDGLNAKRKYLDWALEKNADKELLDLHEQYNPIIKGTEINLPLRDFLKVYDRKNGWQLTGNGITLDYNIESNRDKSSLLNYHTEKEITAFNEPYKVDITKNLAFTSMEAAGYIPYGAGRSQWLLKMNNNNNEDDMIVLQKLLVFLGYLKMPVDSTTGKQVPFGFYGSITKQAVEAFQRAKGLSMDGIVGKDTWNALGLPWEDMDEEPDRLDSAYRGILNNKNIYPNVGMGNLTSALIFQSQRKKGLDQYENQANDMKINDFTKKQLLAINSLFQYQIDEANNPETLFTEFKNMSTQLFSQVEMEAVILDMINHFKDGGGTDYSNATLTAQASAHPTTQAYIQLVKDEFVKELVLHGGILSDLQYNEAAKSTNTLYNYIISNAKYPVFNSWADTLGGLTITINDTWGNNVEVRNYKKYGNKLTGTLHFTIYDHFGLDQPDVEPKYVNVGGVTVKKNYATLAGFRAWYVLQHYNQFNGQYKPFATVMEIDVPFEAYLVGSGGQT